MLEETFDPTKKEAVSQEVLTPPKLLPANDELEIVNLSDDHNMELPISINPLLTPLEKKELMSFLKEYHDVFAWQYEEMPVLDSKMVAHALNIELRAKLVMQPRWIFHPDVEAQIVQEVKKLLATKFIKPIEHPQWLLNIVPVKKKNGKIRCYVDFRYLNKVCPKDEFALPNMDMLINSTTGHEMFSFIDGFSGYNQIKMAPRDAAKTTFYTLIGNFYYTVMPFGLKNTGAMYQRAMSAIFHDMMHRELEDYVDDVVVKS